MKYNGSKDNMRQLVKEAAPGGKCEDIPGGLRYRTNYGVTITWWENTGSILVQGENEIKRKLTEQRISNFLNPNGPLIDTTELVLGIRTAVPMPHPGIKSKFKAPKSALAR